MIKTLILTFRHIFLIKENSLSIDHFQWFWLRLYIFDCFIRLIILKVFFFMSWNFCLRSLYRFCTSFFFSVTKIQERGVDIKQSQKLRSKVKDSFVKLVNYCLQSRYIYALYHVVSGHFIPLTALFSLQIVSIIDLSLSNVAFSVWHSRCSIYWQYFFVLNLALNLLPFCSLLCLFTALLPHFRVVCFQSPVVSQI